MEIRRARSHEVDVVRAVVDEAYSPYVARIGIRPGPMDEDYVAKLDDGLVDVAEIDGEVIGLIVLSDDGHTLLVENVAVRPAFHGRGVGRALLAHADRIAVQRGLPGLRLYTHVAMTENIALYERLGWRETERRTEHGFTRVFFAKPTEADGA